MRLSTHAFLAIRHVGVDAPILEHEGTMESLFKEMFRFVATTGLKRRFQFSIATSREEALKGVQMERRLPEPKAPNQEELDNDAKLAEIMAGYESTVD